MGGLLSSAGSASPPRHWFSIRRGRPTALTVSMASKLGRPIRRLNDSHLGLAAVIDPHVLVGIWWQTSQARARADQLIRSSL